MPLRASSRLSRALPLLLCLPSRSMSASALPALLTAPPPAIQALDCTWYLARPEAARGYGELSLREPCRPLDLNGLSPPGEELPHTPPTFPALSKALDDLGVGPADPLLLYSSSKGLSLYRSYYLLRHYFGHAGSISLLQTPVDALSSGTASGLPAGVDYEALAAAAAPAASYPQPAAFRPAYPGGGWAPLVTLPYMSALVDRRVAGEEPVADVVILDARPAGRFTGSVPEPRAGMRSGHIPTSRSLPFPAVAGGNCVALRPEAELREALEGKGCDLAPGSKQRFVLTCGSGVTACYLAVALELCGVGSERIAVYDGSWSEWGGREDTPVEVGEESV
ncbi:hypothetical protein TeGR_g11240 [Tetraparma gracilis]|uniref:Rhodanese domain-containing protein n=1 Tax=Tetraparma gracilis TaxID=2962635 RepID=A0ABQ6MT83_9STRA|nr:hypothetical protein TeGR_g11240 [Tetraparma gracilis]